MGVSERHYLQITNDLIDAAVNAPGLVPNGGADSGAVTVRTSSQVQEARRNDEWTVANIADPKNAENPRKTGVFLSSKGGTRTRDPRLMKPVL